MSNISRFLNKNWFSNKHNIMEVAGLKGKVIVISGASRGIGRAIALKCAQQGAHIVILAKTASTHSKVFPNVIFCDIVARNYLFSCRGDWVHWWAGITHSMWHSIPGTNPACDWKNHYSLQADWRPDKQCFGHFINRHLGHRWEKVGSFARRVRAWCLLADQSCTSSSPQVFLAPHHQHFPAIVRIEWAIFIPACCI